MTDEQVDRIVQALQGDGESWTTWGVPVLTLILGFLLAQLQAWWAARRAKSDAKAAKQTEIIEAALLHTMYVTGLTPKNIRDDRDGITAKRAEVMTTMLSLDLAVASWWVRQVNRITSTKDAGDEWTTEQWDGRSFVTASILRRLRAYDRGELKATEFVEAKDAEWDATLRG